MWGNMGKLKTKNKFGLPNLGFGMGLRTKHFSHITENRPDSVDWFEIISENFMDTDGRQKRVLEKVNQKYPIVMHGVSLSIGSTDSLNKEYLEKLKKLAEWIKPAWVSDHLCWTGINNTDTHDLLPVPYTKDALEHIVGRIKNVQDFLGRPLVLENPSTYLEFKASQIPEWEFIAEMADKSDCALLLDVNNVYVSCFNHGWDEKTYIDSLPKDRIVQIHIAGHENKGNHIVDTHEGPIIDPVWALYNYVIATLGQISTLVEWDTNIPDFETVAEEVTRARKFAELAQAPNDLPSHLQQKERKLQPQKIPYDRVLPPMHEAIVSGKTKNAPDEWIIEKDNFKASDQLSVYVNGYRYRLFDVVSEDYPVTRGYLGDSTMDELIKEYVEATPSHHFNLSLYCRNLPSFAASRNYLKKDKFAIELLELETAITSIFDRQETNSLDRTCLSSINPEQFIETKLQPRKALSLYEFDYPVSEYYRDIKDGKKKSKPEKRKSYVAIYRHDDEMHRLELEHNEYDLLKLLFADKNIGEALESLIAEKDISGEELAEKFQQWLGRWVSGGLLAA